MNVVVMSDTHMPGRAQRLPPPLVADLELADLIVHAGDLRRSRRSTCCARSRLFQAVHGNVDEPELRRLLPRRLRFELFGRLGSCTGLPSLPTVAARRRRVRRRGGRPDRLRPQP